MQNANISWKEPQIQSQHCLPHISHPNSEPFVITACLFLLAWTQCQEIKPVHCPSSVGSTLFSQFASRFQDPVWHQCCHFTAIEERTDCGRFLLFFFKQLSGPVILKLFRARAPHPLSRSLTAPLKIKCRLIAVPEC